MKSWATTANWTSKLNNRFFSGRGRIVTVCHEAFALLTTVIVQASCSHWFCANCILKTWAHENGRIRQPCKCPVCRRSIVSLTQPDEEVRRMTWRKSLLSRFFLLFPLPPLLVLHSDINNTSSTLILFWKPIQLLSQVKQWFLRYGSWQEKSTKKHFFSFFESMAKHVQLRVIIMILRDMFLSFPLHIFVHILFLLLFRVDICQVHLLFCT